MNVNQWGRVILWRLRDWHTGNPQYLYLFNHFPLGKKRFSNCFDPKIQFKININCIYDRDVLIAFYDDFLTFLLVLLQSETTMSQLQYLNWADTIKAVSYKKSSGHNFLQKPVRMNLNKIATWQYSIHYLL